eukprot:CAMPEP_0176110178 /NCGR_PEP_ID=MMETSP0120_2-20121206/55325_1 /TAXON_ID=160619 /ORGANISM="Kryptoperidinium foliaceum, Strain CCMP 1326" /LENGTH=70 /DNA_ID=CAMNT_0017444383 /DNA_START=78 /DNA_END=286 /DNA_ORIENTATION=-
MWFAPMLAMTLVGSAAGRCGYGCGEGFFDLTGDKDKQKECRKCGVECCQGLGADCCRDYELVYVSYAADG